SPHLFAQERQRIVLCLAGMDDDGEAALLRCVDMAAKALLLPRPVALVIIIVEPGFADTDHARVHRSRHKLRGVDLWMLVGVVRMDADTCPHIVIRLGGGEHVVPFAFACRNVQHRTNAARAGTRQHLALLLGKPLVIEVAMRIDEHQAASSPSPSGSSSLGKIGTGCPTVKPLRASISNQSASASAAKSRLSAPMPIWSSSLSAEPGTTGRIAIARVRTARNKVIRTARMRSGSLLRSAQGAVASTYWLQAKTARIQSSIPTEKAS